MFDTAVLDDLSSLFNMFSVPMFAAERRNAKGRFRLLCINKAHERASGLDRRMLSGAPLQEILPASEAYITEDRYRTCADTGEPQRYVEKLTLPRGVIRWDTHIQHVPMASGADRIIGTTFKLSANSSEDADQLFFDDMRFFASLADLHLENLISVFEKNRSEHVLATDGVARAAHLAGVCRAVRQAITDVEKTVTRRENTARRCTTTALLVGEANAMEVMKETGGNTLQALFDTSCEAADLAD